MFINPYENKLDIKPVRSNFHIHAGTGPGTCGAYDIDPVVDAYKQGGYGALCISNHNIYTDPAEYEKRHGITIFPGYEYTAREHMLAINTDKVCPLPEDVIFRPADEGLIQGPHGMIHRQRNIENLQLAIDMCREDGGYSVLCHPDSFVWGMSWYVIDTMKGYDAIEILNGANTSDTYDHILSRGLLKWCTGSDDFHRWWHTACRWNMILADNTHDDIMAAMRSGAMYVSAGTEIGPTLAALELERNRIYVKIDYFENTDYEIKFIGKDGRVLKIARDREASYNIYGNEAYIRIDVTTPNGGKLLTQPIYDDAFFKE